MPLGLFRLDWILPFPASFRNASRQVTWIRLAFLPRSLQSNILYPGQGRPGMGDAGQGHRWERKRSDVTMVGTEKRSEDKKGRSKRRGASGDDGSPGVITIKKYANRRLYNTATSSYVTLDHLCQMVKDGEDFVVYDAKTGDDITRSVLTQIIVEEEAKGQNLLPIGFLRQLISFYGDSLQMVVPRYLDHAMSTFTENQEQTRGNMKEALGGMFPFGQFEELTKQNMAMFENAFTMFTPPTMDGAQKSSAAEPETPTQAKTETPREPTAPAAPMGNPVAFGDPLKAMQDQLNLMQHQLRALTGGKPNERS
jgi:polyhydroxyalkanoate synthesis repressor PhaR